MSDRLCLLWSIDHDAWWAPNELGYVRELAKAGVYPESRARQILDRANVKKVHECMIPLECAVAGGAALIEQILHMGWQAGVQQVRDIFDEVVQERAEEEPR